MRIQILSDLHAEFHADSGQTFASQYLNPSASDVLVLAGDIGAGSSIFHSIKAISTIYTNPILYVPGNHEFYGSSLPEMLNALRRMEVLIKNLRVMYNDMITIDGQDFVGTTLWFPKTPGYLQYAPNMSDFQVINNFNKEVFTENTDAVKFLDWHVHKNAVVITHHAPTARSVPARYSHSALNAFFVCPLDSFIFKRKPKLWIHGHTHNSFNYMLGKTHVVCNPFGYVGYEINDEFIPNMVIET